MTEVPSLDCGSTYKGVVSEDHWEASKAYPFGVCKTNRTVGAKGVDEAELFVLPDIAQVREWTPGEEHQLALERLSPPADVSQRVASWQQEDPIHNSGGWLIVSSRKTRDAPPWMHEVSAAPRPTRARW